MVAVAHRNSQLSLFIASFVTLDNAITRANDALADGGLAVAESG
jgi:hypothetical protein